jgi:hypothetical protein
MPRDAHVVADAEWRSIAMLLWRPDLVLRSSSWMGKRVLYTAANTEWHRMAPVAPIVAEECRAAPDRVRFSGVRESLGKLTRCATPVPFPRSPLAALPFTWETIEVFAIDCGCVAAQTVK